ncbi:hypothetical protein J6590_097105 [Homalodisca vitripennis]|nr:hypothetical protein J6590_097105 [Homalodisca vitripennis]
MKNKLEKDHLPQSTTNDWGKKSEEVLERWDFPNCVGAIDGKHGTQNMNRNFSYSVLSSWKSLLSSLPATRVVLEKGEALFVHANVTPGAPEHRSFFTHTTPRAASVTQAFDTPQALFIQWRNPGKGMSLVSLRFSPCSVEYV